MKNLKFERYALSGFTATLLSWVRWLAIADRSYYYCRPGKYKTLVYAIGTPDPIRTLHGTDDANDFTGKVYIYKPGGDTPRAVLPTTAKGINGIALKPAGVL